MKTSELQGPALDWAVAKCLGHRVVENYGAYIRIYLPDQKQSMYTLTFCPSADWSQGGPIIERDEIALEPMTHDKFGDGWLATRVEGPAVCMEFGPTMLIAAMRCYVVSQLGEEIKVPEEILDENN